VKTYHKFHVSSARRLSTGCRNLLAEISCWDDLLGQRYTIVSQEDTLESFSDDWVVVDSSRNVVEQFDDQLGRVIARGSLRSASTHASLSVTKRYAITHIRRVLA
jgi:hypothetical protein